MSFIKKFLIISFILIFAGCASVPLKKTNELLPGMTIQEVKNILGEPYSTSLQNEIYIFNYHLQYYLNSSYPYVVAFKQGKTVYFGFNNEEAQRTIQALQMLKGTPILPYTIKTE